MFTYFIGIFLLIKLALNTTFLSLYSKKQTPVAFKISLLQIALLIIGFLVIAIPITLLRFIFNESHNIPLSLENLPMLNLLRWFKFIAIDMFTQKQANEWYKNRLSIKELILSAIITSLPAFIFTSFALGLYVALSA